jgi:hypothetical protein
MGQLRFKVSCIPALIHGRRSKAGKESRCNAKAAYCQENSLGPTRFGKLVTVPFETKDRTKSSKVRTKLSVGLNTQTKARWIELVWG